jgi:hypothetical protein
MAGIVALHPKLRVKMPIKNFSLVITHNHGDQKNFENF